MNSIISLLIKYDLELYFVYKNNKLDFSNDEYNKIYIQMYKI